MMFRKPTIYTKLGELKNKCYISEMQYDRLCNGIDLETAIQKIREEIASDKEYSENEAVKEDIDNGIIIGLQMALDTIDKYVSAPNDQYMYPHTKT